MLTPEEIALIAASFGLPKLLVKMLDVIQQGVGTALEPYYTRKRLEAQSDSEVSRLNKLIEALEKNQKLIPSISYKDENLTIPAKQELEMSLQERTERRTRFQNERKQLNLESVSSYAVSELLDDPEIEDKFEETPIDEDWILRFFRNAEDVSNEDMQRLWGKILAGEVKKPKSFSLRTLDFVRNLSQREAAIFEKMGQFAIHHGEKVLLANFSSWDFSPDSDYPHLLEIMLAKEIGLIHNDLIKVVLLEEDLATFRYQGHAVVLHHTETAELDVLFFTSIGAELLKLLPERFHPNYIADFFSPIASKIHQLMYGKVVNVEWHDGWQFTKLDDFDSFTIIEYKNQGSNEENNTNKSEDNPA
jgi:hypothetical protein